MVRPNTEEFYPLKANGRSALCCTACETDYQEYKRYYSREHQAMTYARNRAYVDKIKTSAGCADCGYNAHAIALDFDHLPGHTKYKNVSKMSINGSSIRALDREIAKCEVVCANCHRVRTAGRYT